jgi:hydrogenase-4 component B
MLMINILIITLITAIILIFPANTRGKWIITLTAVFTAAILSGYYAVNALMGNNYEVVLSGNAFSGDIPFRIDALAGWFILTINFTMLTGAVYGFSYMKKYKERVNELTMHCIAFILAHFSLLGICAVHNSFVFLLLWEIMAISVFILVIFEHHKEETLRAGMNLLVQSHLSIVFIMLGFIYISFRTGSYNFSAIAEFVGKQGALPGIFLFLCFFTGFAIKAGFVPFHTWLPYAHPAAPSHISGIMSGIVIKIGIYGILRMLLLIRTDYTTVGFIILFISVVSGIYGVMLAIIQHDLKKLLSYHSIENIGIIGIGIGLGCIGMGTGNKWMSVLGFSGALLHTLNHSLFKSLLFYSAGNVLQAAGTMNIERLGGLVKKMPRTSLLFLIASLSICGLPPLNGFISEFLIYGGLYNWLFSAGLFSLIVTIFTMAGLALIGGLAIFCFTKAYSIIFLGNPRETFEHEVHEAGMGQLIPMYFVVALIVLIGLFPSFFINSLQGAVAQFTGDITVDPNLTKVGTIESLTKINWLFVTLISIFLAILGLKKLSGRNRETVTGPTWGCGYETADSKLQYTAGSFVRSYVKLAKPVLDIEKKEAAISEVFPEAKSHKTEPYDKIERIFIDKPVKLINRVIDLFLFLQNGQLQSYILYGIIFIVAVLCLPLIINMIMVILRLSGNL